MTDKTSKAEVCNLLNTLQLVALICTLEWQGICRSPLTSSISDQSARNDFEVNRRSVFKIVDIG
jgi:hypothetical protein